MENLVWSGLVDQRTVLCKSPHKSSPLVSNLQWTIERKSSYSAICSLQNLVCAHLQGLVINT